MVLLFQVNPIRAVWRREGSRRLLSSVSVPPSLLLSTQCTFRGACSSGGSLRLGHCGGWGKLDAHWDYAVELRCMFLFSASECECVIRAFSLPYMVWLVHC